MSSSPLPLPEIVKQPMRRVRDRLLLGILNRLDAMGAELAQARAVNAKLAERMVRLEKLLTGTAADRPPGASAAVRTSGDPGVAVVLTTYNRARFVGEAIESVLAQRLSAWEMVVVDDGSTDETAEVVRGFLTDRRIRYLRQENAGSSVARNAGIAATTAPLVAYLDDDNLWYPDFLYRAVDLFATAAEVDFAYAALVTDLHGEDRRILWEPFDRAALERANYIDTNVIVHRRQLIDRYGGWDPAMSETNDWDLALRMTRDRPAFALDVLGARYRECDDRRLTSRRTERVGKAPQPLATESPGAI